MHICTWFGYNIYYIIYVNMYFIYMNNFVAKAHRNEIN